MAFAPPPNSLMPPRIKLDKELTQYNSDYITRSSLLEKLVDFFPFETNIVALRVDIYPVHDKATFENEVSMVLSHYLFLADALGLVVSV